MHKALLLTGLLTGVLSWTAGATQEKPEWQDVKSVSAGKEYPRSVFVPFQTKDLARQGADTASTFYQNLDGVWKFRLYPSPEDVPDNFADPGLNLSDWNEIRVPGNWQMQGYGRPVFADSLYEFNPRNTGFPGLPRENPVGIYRTRFKVPYLWSDRQTFLHLGAVKGGCYVWVNGKKAGYTEDSKNPAEFDISPYVHEGMNTLALEVISHTTGSYLESQRQWRLDGIERSVYLVSQPRVRIRDYLVRTTLDPTLTNGNLDLGVVVKSHFLNPKHVSVFFDLYGPDSSLVSYEVKDSKHRMRSEDTLFFHTMVPRVKKWSPEEPNLYTVVLRLQREKRFAEHIAFRVGFRDVAVRDGKLNVNGRPAVLKGVIYGEYDPETGHVLNDSLLARDLGLMKSLHINAIRTDNYPLSERFYRLADEYGFYVFDEANINSKAKGYARRKGGTPANDPDWLTAHRDRALNMYERNKNHPSVIAWSLGDEAGNGYNFYKAYQLIKGKEKDRPVVYAPAGREWNTDLVFVPAGRLSELGFDGEKRAYIISEYASDLRREGGDPGRELNRFSALPVPVQGAFLGNWADQGLRVDGGTEYGDAGVNRPGMGVVSPDRQLRKEADRIKAAFGNIALSPVDLKAGTFRVSNGYGTADLSAYELRYVLTRDGSPFKEGTLPLSAEAGETETVTLPLGELKMNPNADYALEVSVRLKAPVPYLEKDYNFVSEVYPLNE